MMLGKQVDAFTAATDDAVRRIEAQTTLAREDFDVGVTLVVAAISALATAVVVGAVIIATSKR